MSICTIVSVTCGPWTAEIAKELLGLLTPSQSEGMNTVSLSASLKHALVNPQVSYESVFCRVLDAGRTGISPLPHAQGQARQKQELYSVFSVQRVVA